ncbi:hypothetical protein H4R18_005587 [Coemansia javaensis]|uniref:Chitin-binding type-2 domain-containing protein n=1 Tax=Coemansia javaensis TaxID=2761396 RepID=A0A9W8LF44_9FUNG|nr:hypothetical protein H4R18_005587 [Coemansia javaensis]
MRYLAGLISTLVAAATLAAAVPVDSGDVCSGHTDSQHVGKPFADPSSCGQYLTCGSDGKAYTSICPASTYYDVALGVCSATAKASCGDRKV